MVRAFFLSCGGNPLQVSLKLRWSCFFAVLSLSIDSAMQIFLHLVLAGMKCMLPYRVLGKNLLSDLP